MRVPEGLLLDPPLFRPAFLPSSSSPNDPSSEAVEGAEEDPSCCATAVAAPDVDVDVDT